MASVRRLTDTTPRLARSVCYRRFDHMLSEVQRYHYFSLVSVPINAGDQLLPPSFE